MDHSTFGARYAAGSVAGLAGKLLAFCIAGHHGGLADAGATEEERSRSALAFRLDERSYSIEPVSLPDDFPAPPDLRFPFAPPGRPEEVGFAVAFFTRMLFSALIDADRTATEAFCDSAKSAERTRPKPTLDDLRPALDAFLRAQAVRGVAHAGEPDSSCRPGRVPRQGGSTAGVLFPQRADRRR